LYHEIVILQAQSEFQLIWNENGRDRSLPPYCLYKKSYDFCNYSGNDHFLFYLRKIDGCRPENYSIFATFRQNLRKIDG